MYKFWKIKQEAPLLFVQIVDKLNEIYELTRTPLKFMDALDILIKTLKDGKSS